MDRLSDLFFYFIFFSQIFALSAQEDMLYSKSGRPLARNLQRHMEQAGKIRGRCAILITSDSGRDNTGIWAKEAIENLGHEVVDFRVIPNDDIQIREILDIWIGEGIDAIFTLGGTGFSSRDTTIDVVESLIEKPMPGFGELLRSATHHEWDNLRGKIPEMALLTRASAGKAGESFLFALPGSLDAVQMGIEIILPTLPVLLAERLKT